MANEVRNTEELIQDAANLAKANVGEGSGAIYGTNVHTEFANQIEQLQANGANISSEVSYLNGKVVRYGTKGSVRADVVVGDITKPTAVYDLKTGGAKMTAKQMANYKANLPKSVTSIKEVRPE